MKLNHIFYTPLLLAFLSSATAIAADHDFKNFQINSDALNEKYQEQSNTKRLRHKKGLYYKPQSTTSKSFSSPLMTEVRKYLQGNFSDIEQEQVEALYQRQKHFDLGVRNYNGFAWQKPVGNYSIIADRQIEPNQYIGPKYVVSDVLIIRVNAQTYLRGLQNEGLIEIGDKEFGAFAGLEFRRIFTYKHFSDNYDMALESNMEKLFLSFLFFETSDLEFVAPGEVLTKEDYLGFHAGGFANVPLNYGFELSAGVLIKADKTSKITATIPTENDMLESNKMIQLTYDQTSKLTAGVDLSLKLDFFNLLKLSLIRYEYSVERATEEKLYMAFTLDDYRHFMSSTPVNKSIVKLMRFQGFDNHILDPYIKTYSLNKSINKTVNTRFFSTGSASSTQSEQITTQRLQKKSKFIKHKYSHLNFKQGWKDAVTSIAIQSLLNTDLFSKYMNSYNKKSEYDYAESTNKEFRLKITHEFMVAKTHRKRYNKYKDAIYNFSKDFTNLPDSILHLIDSRKIVGPMKVKSISEADYSSFEFLQNLSKSETTSIYVRLCNSYKNKLSNSRSRHITRCKSKLGKALRRFHKYHNNVDSQLWVFKDVVDALNIYAKSHKQLTLLLGPQLQTKSIVEAKAYNGDVFKYYSDAPKRSKLSAYERFISSDFKEIPKMYFH